MLVTSRCWWLYVGDKFWLLETEFQYWWHLLNVGKRTKPSPTSQSFRQHILSPTFVTNINVARNTLWEFNTHDCRVKKNYLVWCCKRKCTLGLLILNYFLKFLAITATTNKSINCNCQIDNKNKDAKNPVDNQNNEII